MPTIDPSIKVVKTMQWRGGTREYSNRYYFDNLKPADSTKWTTFSDAVVAAEKAIFHSSDGVTIVRTEGYDAGSDVAVFSKTYSQAGTGAWSRTQLAPGECVALVRYSTGQRSVKNHPIYLFNYYHAVETSNSTFADTLLAAQKSAMLTYGNAWVSGFSDGAVTHHRCGPQGHVATGVTVSDNITHRDFPRG